MSGLFIREDHHVEFEAPVLVLLLDGWIDAGAGAATARDTLLGQIATERMGTFDADALIDYRARRPTMTLTDGVIDSLTWPTIELRYGLDRAGNDVLLLTGPEPDVSWRAFSAEVVALARGLDVRLVVGLGSFPAPVPHTRPVKLASTASNADLAEQVGFVSGSLEVSAGMHAVIENACRLVGLPAVGIWARVPHYLSASPYPAAAAALVDGLAAVAGLTLHSGDLHAEADAAAARIDALVADSAEHRNLVRQLEVQVDAVETPPAPEMTLPTGDELAVELERFLREQSD